MKYDTSRVTQYVAIYRWDNDVVLKGTSQLPSRENLGSLRRIRPRGKFRKAENPVG